MVATVMERRLQVDGPCELLRALYASHRLFRLLLVCAHGESLLAPRAPHVQRQGWKSGRRSPPADNAAAGASVSGGSDENTERRGRPRSPQAVVLVAHVRELLVAGDRHDHVLDAHVGEAVPDRAHLRAAGHLRQPRRQVREGHRARHDEDARLASDVPQCPIGAAGQEAAAVAAHQPHAPDAAVVGRLCRRHGDGVVGRLGSRVDHADHGFITSSVASLTRERRLRD